MKPAYVVILVVGTVSSLVRLGLLVGILMAASMAALSGLVLLGILRVQSGSATGHVPRKGHRAGYGAHR